MHLNTLKAHTGKHIYSFVPSHSHAGITQKPLISTIFIHGHGLKKVGRRRDANCSPRGQSQTLCSHFKNSPSLKMKVEEKLSILFKDE